MMEEAVGYQAEEPTKAPVEVDDWRVQEMYNMAFDVVMGELLGLSEEILDAKTEWEETRFELRQARERLKLMEAQVLQAALDSEDKNISDQVKGKNAEERKRRADVYLADHPTIKQLAFEIKPLEGAEFIARLAMEALLDRQKNLHTWARMFEAQVRLLATVRMPIETDVSEEDATSVFDELFPPDVTIPPSMDVSEEDAAAMKAAIERYDESPGPSL